MHNERYDAMILETSRLILRPWEIGDVQDYLDFCNSEFVLRYNAMTPKTEEEILRRFSGPWDGKSLMLVLKERGLVIGEIHIEEDSLRWGVASKELSYLIHRNYSRRGYMKEALRVLIRYLFEEEGLECVGARVFSVNEASLALLRSLGFRQNGYIPRCVKGYRDIIFDDTLHSLFRREWEE